MPLSFFLPIHGVGRASRGPEPEAPRGLLSWRADKAEELIARMKKDIEEIDRHLANIVEYTVDWFRMLKDKYGKGFPRHTELRNFDTIEATKVIEANEKLYKMDLTVQRNP